MEKFMIGLAGLKIQVESEYDYIIKMCRDYVISLLNPDMTVSAAEGKSAADGEIGEEFSPAYLESLDIYRAIAEQLPFYGKSVFHGASITFKDQGFLFTAPSGTGKSTHINLWKKYLGSRVDIVNGDKPILSVENGQDGKKVFVYGTPWAGKEGWQKNRRARLSGICVLKRGAENRIRRLEPAEGLDFLMRQIYFPRSAGAAPEMLEVLDSILALVPVWELECDISEDAVKCSFEALAGEKYEEYRTGDSGL